MCGYSYRCDEVEGLGGTLRPGIAVLLPRHDISVPKEELAERHLLQVVWPLAVEHFPGGDGQLPHAGH